MNRSVLRALLTSAAIAAAIGLSACDQNDIPVSGRALAPLSPRMLSLMEEKRMDKESPILARIFKEEAELEIWKRNRDGQYELLKTYPICRWSGDLGPKKKQGDRQAPEGFYTITPGQMNPASNYYLAFNTGFPNAYDRAMGYTGSDLMVHGDCSSRGCYAMTDEQIQEIYALARESFFGGQQAFQLQAFPFRMTAMNMARHRNNPNFAFWRTLKDGYDHFEATHQEPKVAVCERHYVFDPAAPDGASKPLKFDARGKCPVYQLDPTIAEVVLDKRRTEQTQMAEYISRNVSTVPMRVGDGGGNQVFASKFAAYEASNNYGRTYQLASSAQAPGYLPRTKQDPAPRIVVGKPPVQPQQQQEQQQEQQEPTQPVVMASVPVPRAAPLPKEGEAPVEQPKATGLFAHLFGGGQPQAQPQPEAQPQPAAPAETEQVALRGSDTPAKPKRPTTVVRAAAVPAPMSLSAKPRQQTAAAAAHAPAPTAPAWPKPAAAAPAWPKAVAQTPPAKPAAKPQQTAKAEPPAAPAVEIRTAYAPPASSGGLLSGAQPVVPVGGFR